jgi:hypothetical protein
MFEGSRGRSVQSAVKRLHEGVGETGVVCWTPLWDPKVLEGQPRVLRVWNHPDGRFVSKEKPSKKRIRAFLWEIRNERKVIRDDAVLWSVYDPKRKSYWVGIGVAVSERLLPRLARTSLIDPEE